MEKKEALNKDYWEKNIEGFSGFYDTKSEETIIGNKITTFFYKKFLFPIEKKYMMQRHKMVSDYISKNVREGITAADIGCGSGVYVKQMIDNKVDFVYALDYANSAVELTKRNLKSLDNSKVKCSVFDVTKDKLEKVNVAISIGVLPYIDDLSNYLNNILLNVDTFLFNFLDAENSLNKIRKKLSFLDVRKYSYHSLTDVEKEINKLGFSLVKKEKLATGWMLEVKKK